MTSFLDIKDLSKKDLIRIIDDSIEIKKNGSEKILKNKNVLMIFEKPSLRTRISFEVCINDLGGNSLILNSNEFKFGERESIHDSTKVLDRYIDFIIIRSFEHSILKEVASNFSKPIINALTNHSHPCQVIADLVTFKEKFGEFKNKKVSWFGDFNNVTQSWIEAAAILDINFSMACPSRVLASKNTIKWLEKQNKNLFISENINDIAKNSDCIMTDTWISMGDQKDKSVDHFKPFQVNSDLMLQANKNAIFMHCLPAYRGMEVTDEVIDSKSSAVFDQAENRVHAQKSIIKYCCKS
tara:strand:- start:393 stop:1283 length:891 start_codon:yes stop_codon:yes gene_type:complete